ncbi:uncharacterized protein TNCV_3038641 [Trichonephila clavipes]|nr:uncharacterized protein TNCV_3038641 [Trichonephila clavipes]
MQQGSQYLRKLAAQLRNREATALHHILPHYLNKINKPTTIFIMDTLTTLGELPTPATHDLPSHDLSSDLFSVWFGNSSNDHQARRRFVEWAQNEIAVVPDFHKRILFTDEAPFWLNGYVNKQNCRIWREANPQLYVETPLHPEKLTVWCALWAGGIIGPYFFKNDEGMKRNGSKYQI